MKRGDGSKVKSAKRKPRAKKAAKREPKKIGRPTIYTEKIAAEICRRLHESDGDELPESLRAICRDPNMPSLWTVLDWLKDDSKNDFHQRYARARQMRKDALIDRLLSLADRAKRAAYGEAGTGEAGARVQAYKIEIDALKWILSKEYARDYGDKITQEISGPDGGPIVTDGVKRSDEEMKAFALMVAKAEAEKAGNEL